MSDRIRWTTGQRNAISAELVAQVRLQHPHYELRSSQSLVTSEMIQQALPKAQLVLDRDFHRTFFSTKEMHEFVVDVSRQLWQWQQEEKSLTQISNDRLLNLLSDRFISIIEEKVLDRLAPEINKMVDQAIKNRLSELKEFQRHDPQMTPTTREELPTYVIIGTLPDQENDLNNYAKGRINLRFVRTHEYGKADALCKGKTVIAMKFIDHSMYYKTRDAASVFHYVNKGGVSEVKRLIAIEYDKYLTLKGVVRDSNPT